MKVRFALALTLILGTVEAQGLEQDQPSGRELSVRPPQLLEFAEPAYPAPELASPREAEVGLKLTIDAAGNVKAVEVARSAGAHFDSAAQAAAKELRFAPAERDGKPVAVKILFQYRFRLPLSVQAGLKPEVSRPAEPPPAAPPPAALSSKSLPRRQTSQIEASASTNEIIVKGSTPADSLRQSAEAVQVVEVERDKRRSADLGELLARSEGIAVQRSGGVGSVVRFSLNGLSEDQVRFFVDGVPLELTGHLFGVTHFPVGWARHVEVYRGVVPGRFAIDALGGAVNVATDPRLAAPRGSVSYQVGSYGTYRLAATGQHRHSASGAFARVNAYVDSAKNDYSMLGSVPQLDGSQVTQEVRRFHDAYHGRFGSIEGGVINQPWARRLSLHAFASSFDKDLQHNRIMSMPYGEVRYGRSGAGAHARYEHGFGNVQLETVLAYAHTRSWFEDLGRCVYSWQGRCLAPLGRPGEIEAPGKDTTHWDHNAYGAARASWQATHEQTLRLSISGKGVARTGKDRLVEPGEKDPLRAERRVLSVVTALEHQADLLDGRLQNILFGKQYTQLLRSEDPVVRGILRRRDRETVRFGAGNSVRYRLRDDLFAKASYEFATRLPSAEEIFGDAAQVNANLELEPEVSHNLNLGVHVALAGDSGTSRAELNGFFRDSDQLIVRLGNESMFRHENVFRARTLGAEASASWTSPGELLLLSANATYLDRRSVSSNGTFGRHRGDRIPNQPYLFGNSSAELRIKAGAHDQHEFSIFFNVRYVHEYFLGWPSLGDARHKPKIPSQLLHTAAITYIAHAALNVSSTFEIQNLSNARSYDFYGVPRPGRAYFFRGTAEF